MRVLRFIVHIVAAAALLGGALSAFAQAGVTPVSSVTSETDSCRRLYPDPQITGRSNCAKDVYKEAGVWGALKIDLKCAPNGEAGVIDISKCDAARATKAMKPPQAESSGTAGTALIVGKATNPSAERTGVVAAPTEGTNDPSPTRSNQLLTNAQPSDGGWAWNTIIAFAIAALSLAVSIGVVWLVQASHKAEVENNQRARSEAQTLGKRTLALEEELSSVRVALQGIKRGLEDERSRQRHSDRSAYDSRSPSAHHAVPAPDSQTPVKSATPTIIAFQDALIHAFRVLVSRNAPLTTGREFERLVAAIEDKQVASFIGDRGAGIHRLLDSNGTANNVNPTLFAIHVSRGDWLIFPMPFAERTGMYRRWFDGFDESKSMTASRPARGKDSGGAIELTAKGQLA